jgi:hypothetical protein
LLFARMVDPGTKEDRQMVPEPAPVQSLLICPKCKLEMRLVGTESETTKRDLYTFECVKCGRLDVRGVRVR